MQYRQLFFAALLLPLTTVFIRADALDDTDDFLIRGLPVTIETPGVSAREYSRYQAAIIKFRENSCLLPAQSVDAHHSKLDWGEINNLLELQVCIFFSAKNLRDLEEVGELLTESGFNNVRQISREPNSPANFIPGSANSVSATFNIQDLPASYGGFLRHETWAAYGMSIGIYANADGDIIHVHLIYLVN